MAQNRDEDHIEEPDVTPLINVNFVILVMVLAIASHAAKLLPLMLPKAEETQFLGTEEAIALVVKEDKTYELGGKTGLSKDAVDAEIDALANGSILLVSMDPKAKYEQLVWAMDRIIARPTLQIAFGQPGQPGAKTVKVKTAEPAAPEPAK